MFSHRGYLQAHCARIEVRKNDIALQENCNIILIEEVDPPMFALLRPLAKPQRFLKA